MEIQQRAVIVELIGATTTKTGLNVRAELDKKIPIQYKTSRRELNYVIKPGIKL